MQFNFTESDREAVVTGSTIHFPFTAHQDLGVPMPVAKDVWWIRLPIDSHLEYVNSYAIRDGKSLTLVDTGVSSDLGRMTLERALTQSELAPYQVSRVIVTHCHPDHIGLAGWLHKRGAELWMSRTCWLTCKLLMQSDGNQPSEAEVDFMRRAGLEGIELEAFKRQPSRRYKSLVTELPNQFVPLSDSQQIPIGDRVWKVFCGNGHAADHLTLWSEDLAILGDQILPSISSNLSIPFTEPDGDLIDEWLLSCQKLLTISDDVTLGLPGHQRPFTGVRCRLNQIIGSTNAAIDRMRKLTLRPCSAIECMEQFYGRKLSFDQRKQMLPEIVGYLNYLCRRGELEKSTYPQGTIAYRRRKVIPSTKPIDAPWNLTGSCAVTSTPVLTSAVKATEADALSAPVATPDLSLEPIAKRSGTSLRFVALVVLAILLGSALVVFKVFDIQKWNDITTWLEPLRAVGPHNTSESLPSDVLAVDTMTVHLLPFAEVPRIFTGIVKARRVSEIGFNRLGTIASLLVERGQLFEKDTPLATLNTNSLKANLKAVTAQQSAANARLEELLAGPRQQSIQSARNLVASATAEFELATVSFGRAERLVQLGAVSRQDFDNAHTAKKAKQESLHSAQNALDELLEGTRLEQIQAQRAVVKELEAAIEQLQVQIDESVLHAPFEGVIAEKFLDVGAVCSPGIPVFRLVETDHPEVWFGIPLEYLAILSQSRSHVIQIQGHENEVSMKTILPELDSGTRTKTVVFQLENAKGIPTLGQVAEIRLQRVLRQSGCWLPMAAILKGDNGLAAALVLEPETDGTAIVSKRDLHVLFVDSDRAYVSGYLSEGELIVPHGLQRLSQGQRVRLNSSAQIRKSIAGEYESSHEIQHDNSSSKQP